MQFVKESIVLSSIRAFFHALFSVIGILIGLVLLFTFIAFKAKPASLIPTPSISIVPDASGQSTPLPETAPIIMKLNIHNIVGMHALTEEHFQNLLHFSSQAPYRNRIKGIILSINSPGGTVFDSNAIYSMLKSYKKKHKIPIFSYVKSLCASGGYYIACASDKIYASPVGIIGSVGVKLGPNFNYYDAMQKIGLKELTLTEGKNKDIIPKYSPLDPEDGAKPPSYHCLIDILHSQYMRFLDIVASARKNMNRDKLEEEYGAQVYISQKAQELGFIDVADSTYEKALTGLTEQAGIKTPYQVLEFTYKPTLFDSVISSKFIQKVLSPFNLYDKFMPFEATLKDSFLHIAPLESQSTNSYE